MASYPWPGSLVHWVEGSIQWSFGPLMYNWNVYSQQLSLSTHVLKFCALLTTNSHMMAITRASKYMHTGDVFCSLEDGTSEETTPVPEGTIWEGNAVFRCTQREVLSEGEGGLQVGTFSWKSRERGMLHGALQDQSQEQGSLILL